MLQWELRGGLISSAGPAPPTCAGGSFGGGGGGEASLRANTKNRGLGASSMLSASKETDSPPSPIPQSRTPHTEALCRTPPIPQCPEIPTIQHSPSITHSPSPRNRCWFGARSPSKRTAAQEYFAVASTCQRGIPPSPRKARQRLHPGGTGAARRLHRGCAQAARGRWGC